MGISTVVVEKGLSKEQLLMLQELLKEKVSLIKKFSLESFSEELEYSGDGFEEPNFPCQRKLTIEWEEKSIK